MLIDVWKDTVSQTAHNIMSETFRSSSTPSEYLSEESREYPEGSFKMSSSDANVNLTNKINSTHLQVMFERHKLPLTIDTTTDIITLLSINTNLKYKVTFTRHYLAFSPTSEYNADADKDTLFILMNIIDHLVDSISKKTGHAMKGSICVRKKGESVSTLVWLIINNLYFLTRHFFCHRIILKRRI